MLTPPVSLQNLQTEFAELLLSHETAMPGIEPSSHICIYQNNVRTNLIHALQHIYPLIETLVGADFFKQLASHYIEQYPSRSGDIHDYGEYLNVFLENYPQTSHLVYLPEVAHFEWICHHLLSSPDHEALDPHQLEQITPDSYSQLYLVLHPASHILTCHYPLLDIIALCKGEIDQVIDIDKPADSTKSNLHLLMIRRHLDISLMTLTQGEYAFLEAIQHHAPLAEALAVTLAIDPDFNLAAHLPVLAQNKTIVGYYLAKKA